jgi:hypothetical protein
LLNISSTWIKIRLYTENQLPRLPGSRIKVYIIFVIFINL